jgi:hypothetical protein
MYLRLLDGVHRGYGKDTIFNGSFESSKSSKIEQLFAENGLFRASRVRVNLILLTVVAARTVYTAGRLNGAVFARWRSAGNRTGWRLEYMAIMLASTTKQICRARPANAWVSGGSKHACV